jgi:hypothetical protein
MRARRFWKGSFIFPVLILVLVAGCVIPAADGQGVTETARQPVVLTQWTLRHIQQRHWPDSPAEGAGKFAVGITEESLREMINEAVANGRSRENTHGRPGEIYEYDFGRPIGTTINGGPASRLRVVISMRGQVVTAFPF